MSRRRPIPIDIIADTGSDKAAEASDPYVATAVGFATPGHDGLAEMARAFVEEFALLGWRRERLERMFRMPRYVAAHRVYVARGPEFVSGLIDEVLGPRPAQED